MTAPVTEPDVERFRLRKEEVQLLIIDVQDRLVAAMPEADKVVANVGHLLALSKMFSIPVLVTEQYPKGLGPTVPVLAEAIAGTKPVEKTEFSCIEQCDVASRLTASGRHYVVIAGIEAHVCVLQTCMDLLADGYIVHIVRDAVSSRSEENKQNALEMMRDAGAVITTTETVLFQVLGRAGTDEFKAISKRIK